MRFIEFVSGDVDPMLLYVIEQFMGSVAGCALTETICLAVIHG